MGRPAHRFALQPQRVKELEVTSTLRIPMSEIDMDAVRSQGAGGQNVNKVATAIHLRFDIRNSPSLPEDIRERLLASGDQRISSAGVLVIKSQKSRSQERNREEALRRLAAVITDATRSAPPRIPTRPSKVAKKRRVDDKTRRGVLKRSRHRPTGDSD
ncbi:MAG TPA: alternative ribosome rescue aminoacyl-tRNA hydrolase ArfB [Woeseiaceae bacterium]|nr:alternative ribosome rescue aminoacyl-tRNA hydrolase ArfB [Woeseiaceae bacterium]